MVNMMMTMMKVILMMMLMTGVVRSTSRAEGGFLWSNY